MEDKLSHWVVWLWNPPSPLETGSGDTKEDSPGSKLWLEFNGGLSVAGEDSGMGNPG